MEMKCFEFSFFFKIPLLFGTHPSLGAMTSAAVFISNCFISFIAALKFPSFACENSLHYLLAQDKLIPRYFRTLSAQS